MNIIVEFHYVSNLSQIIDPMCTTSVRIALEIAEICTNLRSLNEPKLQPNNSLLLEINLKGLRFQQLVVINIYNTQELLLFSPFDNYTIPALPVFSAINTIAVQVIKPGTAHRNRENSTHCAIITGVKNVI